MTSRPVPSSQKPSYGKQRQKSGGPSALPEASHHRALTALSLALVIVASVVLSLRPISDSDFWHHIAFGRVLVEQGHFPVTDTLGSTTADRYWVSSGWVPSVMLYHAYKLSPEAGPYGVVTAVVILVALTLFGYGMKRTGSVMLVSTVTIAALGASAPRFLPRPDLFSQAFMPALLILLVWYQQCPLNAGAKGWLRAAALPLLFAAWANCHMLFVVGFAVASLFMGWALWEWKQGRRSDGIILIATWVASALACFATPYGWRAFWFILENADLDHASSRINELKPLYTAIGEAGAGASFFCLAVWLLLCAWLLLGRQFQAPGRPRALWQWAVMIFLLILAVVQRRQIALAVPGISILVFAGMPAGSFMANVSAPIKLLVPAAMLLLMKIPLTAAGFLPPIPEVIRKGGGMGVDCDWLPCEAVDFLKQNPPPANLFHDLYTGSFLAYQLTPATRVLIDGRLEAYNNGIYNDFFGPVEGTLTIEELFKKYKIHSALIDWRDAAVKPNNLAASLSQQPDWHLCWFSDHYALFVKENAGSEVDSYLASHSYKFLNPLFPQGYMAALSNPRDAGAAKAEARRAAQQAAGSALARKALEVSGQL